MGVSVYFLFFIFLREESLVCAETALCSSSLITALLVDKARHAL